MCGIVGILTPVPDLRRSIVDAMRDRLAHRGPDGRGSWQEATPVQGSIALGHRRLSIIDLRASADQPMFSADGRYVIVYNGEIYNYVELREELRQDGIVFRTDSDTEVLLAAYARWGADCLGRLNGMFAFLLWDRVAGTLFVARDRFGEKPLYMARLPEGGLAFASEAKALFAYPGLGADVNQAMLGHFAAGGALGHDEETLFANVRRLPAATALMLDATGRELRRWRYWTPDYTKTRKDVRPADAAAEFAERLKASLRLRLRSDVQVGACLSGGLDSSTLVGFLSQLQPVGKYGPAITYSARFDDDPTISEGDYIDRVLAHVGAQSYAISPRGDEFATEARQLYWHQEIPFQSMSIYLEWRVLKRARETGVTVMIDGQGADELLGGYPSFFPLRQRDLVEQGRFLQLWQDTRALNGRLEAAGRRYVASDRRFNAHIALGVQALGAMAVAHLRRHVFKTGAVSPRPVLRAGEAQGLSHFRRQLAGYLLHDSLPDQLHSADRSGMAFGVETRFPFLDHELVDWCIGLPDDVMMRDGWQKWILREAAGGAIPEDVRWRPDKVGYRAPQDRWLREGVKDWMAERLFDSRSGQLPNFDRHSLETAWQEHMEGRLDRSWQLFRWASAIEWCALADENIWSEGLVGRPDIARDARVADPLEAV